MRFYHYLIIVSCLFLLSFSGLQNPIHKEWRLVAEEISYFNFDYTPYTDARSRLDSVQNEKFQFLPDGSFISSEGKGTYVLVKDSIHLRLNGVNRFIRYEINDSKLILESHFKESKYIVRSKLYLE